MEGDLVNIETSSQGYRKRQKKDTKREKQSKLRYTNHFPNAEDFNRPCCHDNKPYNCNNITVEDIIILRKNVYNVPSKCKVDEKISHLLIIKTPKRRRKNVKTPQSLRIKYLLRSKNGETYKVCQKLFLCALMLSQRRVITIAKKKKEGEIKEKRGGDRRSNAFKEKRYSIKKFINQLEGKESHYNRNKSRRIYLPSELNVAKLNKMYNAQTENDGLKVSYRYFYNIFVSEYNVGFGTPATDVCSLCTRLKNELKVAQPDVKIKIMTELRVHKLRAKQFTLFMKEMPENSVTFCFDLQQVQALPKLNIQEAFYLRQLALYNFCITDVRSVYPHFYTWTENQAGRGANEIGSAVFDFLSSFSFPEDCSTLRLFADGCGGQNKNTYIIHMLMFWLINKAPAHLDEVVLYFPVRGHSYLPADRVFGRVEKLLRRQSKIINREGYWKIFKEVGEVKLLGKDWSLLNFKSLSDSLKKVDGIKEVKRIFIQRTVTGNNCVVKTEINYRNDDSTKKFQSYTKPGKSLKRVVVPNMDLENELKKVKLKNIEKLLNEYNRNWRSDNELAFFKVLLDNPPRTDLQCEDQSLLEECDCLEEDIGLRI